MQILQNTYQTRFHGGNTGSNPVGDAKYFQKLSFQVTPGGSVLQCSISNKT